MAERASLPTSFWSAVIPANGKVNVTFPDDCLLTLTGAVLSDVSDVSEPVRLYAEVSTIDIESDNAVPERDAITILLSCLTPGKEESRVLAATFSLFNAVTLRVVGNGSVHVSGVLSLIAEGEYADEEEEEEDDDEADEKKEESSEEEEVNVMAKLAMLSRK